jgi:hypothetical protein
MQNEAFKIHTAYPIVMPDSPPRPPSPVPSRHYFNVEILILSSCPEMIR